MAAPVVDPDAGVEALFWRVHVRDEFVGGRDLQRILNHYVRLKVFSEKGKDQATAIRLPSSRYSTVTNIAGRTILPDGTVLELKGSDIHDRETFSAGGLKLKEKSFAMPGVAPGAIVEYRWREIRFDPRTLYLRLQIQQEFPVHVVTYYLKPLPPDITTYEMSMKWFNWKSVPLKLERTGFHSLTFENVPAFKPEPMMPGEPNVRPWALVFYHDGSQRKKQQKYWEDEGKSEYRRLGLSLRANNDIRAAAAKAVEGAADDEARVVALIRYVRENMRDLYGDEVTDAERANLIRRLPKTRARTSVEVFESRIGTANELNTLFAAMASAIGLDARPARLGSKNDMSFTPELMDIYFLPNIDMAVNIGGTWRIFDVSARLLPARMLTSAEEGVAALVSDSKTPVLISTPLSQPADSAIRRNGRFKLLEDGTLEGAVLCEYTGHEAHGERVQLEGMSEAKMEESIKDGILAVHPDSEVSGIAVENAGDPEQPLRIGYTVKIAGYAQRTGRRLLVQPLYFQRGTAPLFTATERNHDLQFPHAWSESDTISIEWPEGFQLDSPENPGGMEFGKPGNYVLKMNATEERVLTVERTLVFGNEGLLYYPKQSYLSLKRVFDELHSRDAVTLVLQHTGAAGGAQ